MNLEARQIRASEQDAYFKAAASWEHDRVRAALRSRKLAWAVASGACGVAVVAVAAVAMLAPLKTVAPYVIRVDRSTGETQIVTALKGPGTRTYDEAVNRFFVSQYVRLREGWLPQAARDNAYGVTLMSAQPEQARYLAFMAATNKNSPQVRIGDSGFVAVSVRSISFLSPTVAQVRFSKVTTIGTTPPTVENWLATLTFQFTSAPELERDRLLNPLGFQVLNYQADPEV